MITGFFYTDIVDKRCEKKQIIKIFALMIEANLLYLLWKCFYIVASGNTIGEYLSQILSVKSIVEFGVLNESPFNGHLWYLGAILYVLLIMLGVEMMGKKKILYVLTPLLLMSDLILGKYSMILFHREFPYIIARNFLFVGFPYFCIGELLRSWKKKIRIRTIVLLVALFSCTTLFERYLLIRNDLNTTRDHYISTTFLAIAVFLLFKEVYSSRHRITYAERWVAKIGRNYSTWIYIVHPILITVIGTIMRRIGLYGVYQYIVPVMVYIMCIIFVWIVIEGFKRIKFIQKN